METSVPTTPSPANAMFRIPSAVTAAGRCIASGRVVVWFARQVRESAWQVNGNRRRKVGPFRSSGGLLPVRVSD